MTTRRQWRRLRRRIFGRHSPSAEAAAVLLGLALAIAGHTASPGTAGGGSHAPAPAPAGPVSSGSPVAVGEQLATARGWTGGQWDCLRWLWTRESGWDTYALNPTSGAYGIPQSLPAAKMAAAGADWRTDPATQIRWGLGYIAATYGTPCAAWAHEETDSWY